MHLWVISSCYLVEIKIASKPYRIPTGPALLGTSAHWKKMARLSDEQPAVKRRVTGSLFSMTHEVSSELNTGFRIRCSWVKNIMGSCLSFWNVCTVTQDHFAGEQWSLLWYSAAVSDYPADENLFLRGLWHGLILWYCELVFFYFVGCYPDQPISAKVVNLLIGPTSKTHTIEDYNYIVIYP